MLLEHPQNELWHDTEKSLCDAGTLQKSSSFRSNCRKAPTREPPFLNLLTGNVTLVTIIHFSSVKNAFSTLEILREVSVHYTNDDVLKQLG